jgi:drug/metabolite transporter (DMT)-like permease
MAAFFWGTSFIAAKVAVAAVPPLTVAALRVILAALGFLIWFAAGGWPNPPDRHHWSALFGLSLLGTGLHYGLMTIGLQFTTASHGSIFSATGPIGIALTAAMFGARITSRQIAGIGLALAGALVIQGNGLRFRFEAPGQLLGDGLVFFSILMWGGFTVFGKRLVEKSGALPVIGLTTLIGAAWMIPVSGLELAARSFSLTAVPLKVWLAIAFLGVACTFLAPLFYFLALEHAPAQKVGVYLYAVPLLTYIIAGLVLHERLGPELLIGSILILSGVFLTERG